MKRISAVVTIAASVVLASSCGSAEPSYTRMMCDRLLAAHAARDGDRVQQVVDEMSDIGTQDDPTAVVLEVYVHVLAIQNALREGSQPTFNAALEALVAECRKAD
jgi:hypothetical protein